MRVYVHIHPQLNKALKFVPCYIPKLSYIIEISIAKLMIAVKVFFDEYPSFRSNVISLFIFQTVPYIISR